jgi:hypothetical protein
VADRIRGAPAVVEQLGEVAVAGDGDVLPERRQQRAAVVDRQPAFLEVRPQGGDDRMIWVGRAAQRSLEPVEFGEARLRRRFPLVGDVVREAREAVESDQRGAQRARHQHRSDREILVVIDAGDEAGRGRGVHASDCRQGRARRVRAQEFML